MEPELPTGIELTPLSESFKDDPYPTLHTLRQREPVHGDEQLQRYVFTDYHDIKAILRNHELFSNPTKSKENSFSRMFMRNDAEISMLFMDEPEHGRMRKLVNDIFTPKAVARWRPRIVEIIEQQLNQLHGPEFELMRDFAGPVPTVIIAEMMGIASGDYVTFKTWSEILAKTSFNPLPTEDQICETRAAEAALNEFFLEQIEYRRKMPGNDLISQMLAARIEGDQLTDTEIITQCRLLLVAGNVTTTDLIGNGVKALLDHPLELAKLQRNPELIANAVEEILRYDSPVMNSGRIAHTDIEIRGCPIDKGDTLSVFLGGANRDPNAFEEPDAFDIERRNIHHLSFGGGRHFCLGAALARLEAQEAIARLFNRFPGLQLSEKGFARAAVPGFRGLECFWLRPQT